MSQPSEERCSAFEQDLPDDRTLHPERGDDDAVYRHPTTPRAPHDPYREKLKYCAETKLGFGRRDRSGMYPPVLSSAFPALCWSQECQDELGPRLWMKICHVGLT